MTTLKEQIERLTAEYKPNVYSVMSLEDQSLGCSKHRMDDGELGPLFCCQWNGEQDPCDNCRAFWAGVERRLREAFTTGIAAALAQRQTPTDEFKQFTLALFNAIGSDISPKEAGDAWLKEIEK